MALLKLKKLEEYLQCIDDFEKPKVLLEQYSTPAHIASCMLYEIQTKFGDIEDKFVGDLGAGCGMLAIGASLLGARLCVGFEIDTDAIKIFRNNINEMEINDIDYVQCNMDANICDRWQGVFDTIIMNPPFGTKKKFGQDMLFLEAAIKMTNNVVYSLHKTSTRDFVKKKGEALGVKAEVFAELRYNIEAKYKFHKKTSVDIDVDCWRFCKPVSGCK